MFDLEAYKQTCCSAPGGCSILSYVRPRLWVLISGFAARKGAAHSPAVPIRSLQVSSDITAVLTECAAWCLCRSGRSVICAEVMAAAGGLSSTTDRTDHNQPTNHAQKCDQPTHPTSLLTVCFAGRSAVGGSPLPSPGSRSGKQHQTNPPTSRPHLTSQPTSSRFR